MRATKEKGKALLKQIVYQQSGQRVSSLGRLEFLIAVGNSCVTDGFTTLILGRLHLLIPFLMDEARMSQSNVSAGDPKETSDGTVMPPAAEEGDSENKMQLSELLKRHSSQEPGL